MGVICVGAKFKGANGSLNYVTGKTYILNFMVNGDREIEICDREYAPDSATCGQLCTYESMKSFLSNWEVLE